MGSFDDFIAEQKALTQQLHPEAFAVPVDEASSEQASGVLGTAKVLGYGLYDAVTDQLPEDAARWVRGGQNVNEDTWMKRVIDQQAADKGERAPARQAMIGNSELNRSIYEGAQSVAGSTTLGVAGMLAGSAAGPGGAALASGALVGAGAYRQAKDQILQQALEHALKLNPNLTGDEWQNLAADLEGKASEYGAWEAIPQAVMQAATIGLIKGTPGNLVSKIPGMQGITEKIGGNIFSRVGAKLGADIVGENIEEATTFMGQGGIEKELGLRGTNPTLGEYVREQAGPVTAGAAIGMGITGGIDRIAQKFAAQGQADAPKTENQMAEQLAKQSAGQDPLKPTTEIVPLAQPQAPALPGMENPAVPEAGVAGDSAALMAAIRGERAQQFGRQNMQFDDGRGPFEAPGADPFQAAGVPPQAPTAQPGFDSFGAENDAWMNAPVPWMPTVADHQNAELFLQEQLAQQQTANEDAAAMAQQVAAQAASQEAPKPVTEVVPQAPAAPQQPTSLPFTNVQAEGAVPGAGILSGLQDYATVLPGVAPAVDVAPQTPTTAAQAAPVAPVVPQAPASEPVQQAAPVQQPKVAGPQQPAQTGDREVGLNYKGEPVYEDAKGVRFVREKAGNTTVKMSSPVAVHPRYGAQPYSPRELFDQRHHEYLTQDELADFGVPMSGERPKQQTPTQTPQEPDTAPPASEPTQTSAEPANAQQTADRKGGGYAPHILDDKIVYGFSKMSPEQAESLAAEYEKISKDFAKRNPGAAHTRKLEAENLRRLASELREKLGGPQSGATPAGPRFALSLKETRHAKKGHPVYVVTVDRRVSSDEYNALKQEFTKLGGYWSSYQAKGAIKGVQFTDKAKAEEFMDRFAESRVRTESGRSNYVESAEALAKKYKAEGKTRQDFSDNAPTELGWVYPTSKGGEASIPHAPIQDAFKEAGYKRPGNIAEVWDRANGEDAPAPATPEPKAASGNPLVAHFAEQLASPGKSYRTIVEARKEAEQILGRKIADTDRKTVEEAVEAGAVQAARELITMARQQGRDPRVIYQRLVDLYQRMPRLGTRTSVSMMNQAYSTPVPIAYVANQLAGIAPGVSVYEPTAGNGALLIGADANAVIFANELQAERAANLKALGYEVSTNDATEFVPWRKVDAVVMNPPFGHVQENGQNKTWTVDGFTTTEIDHAIALKGLEAMDKDGKAVLILGGKMGSDETRTGKYRTGTSRDFFAKLYNDYNVTDHFSVNGDLYERQGAGYPIDVVVIEGRGKSSLVLPGASVPRIYNTFDALEEVLHAGFTVPKQQVDLESASATGRLLGLGDAGANTGRKADKPGAILEPAPGEAGLDDKRSGGPAGSNAGADAGAGESVLPRPGRPEGDALPDSGERVPAGNPGKQGGQSSAEGDDAGNVSRDADGRPGKSGRPAGQRGGLPNAGDRPGVLSPIEEELQSLSPEELDALVDEVADKYEPKPTEHLKNAATDIYAAMGDALDGLVELFGGSKLNSGLTFNEETYAKAKPLFASAWENAKAAGHELRQFIDALLKKLGPDARPFIKRYVSELQTEGKKPAEKPAEKPVAEATDLQVNYVAKSGSGSMGDMLVPVNMQASVQEALDFIEETYGNIDDFVAKELGYSKGELYNALGDGQVDAVALGIHNMKTRAGFIIGDQTGIGKGRVVAAMIRYAKKQGAVPVFVTVDPKLYVDMLRDLNDIGEEVKPFATNGKPLQIPTSDPDDPEFIKFPNMKKELPRVRSVGLKEAGYDVVFTTYKQLAPNKSRGNPRQAFLAELAPNAFFILDESHNAGGVAENRSGKSADSDGGAPGTASIGSFVRSVLRTSPFGVFYSSATYAKRPDVMGLYFRTDMAKAVKNVDNLKQVMARGGVPLQQVVASMLAKAKQYIRRERSFKGAEYSSKRVEGSGDYSDKLAAPMSAVQEFSAYIQELLPEIQDDLAALGGTAGLDGSIGEGGMNSTNFTSVMHNLINQYTLAVKAEAVADEAIEAIKTGERPVIALASTMGAFIEEYAAENNVANNGAFDATFNDVVDRYLERSRELTIKQGKDTQFRIRIPDELLGPEGVALYERAKDVLAAQDLSELAVSPIDAIRNRIEKAGYTIDEITGRQMRLDYSGAQTKLVNRKKATTADTKTINDFNSGKLHAVLLNSSGATGISLHSSKGFKNQDRRHMIIAQPLGDINEYMQMLGRVFRTGQVVPPKYTYLMTDMPAEIRPAAVLGKKMAMLNANTTANRKSSQQAADLPDFINQYGDQVAREFLAANRDLADKLDIRLKAEGEEEGGRGSEVGMSKLTGRLPLLPRKQQAEIYEHLDQLYKDLMTNLEAMGESTLEAPTYDFQAKPVGKSIVMADGDAQADSPFLQPANVQAFSLRRLSKPYTAAQVKERLGNRLGLGPDASTRSLAQAGDSETGQIRDKLWRDFNAYLDKRLEAFDTSTDVGSLRAETARIAAEAAYAKVSTALHSFPIGSAVNISTADQIVNGIVLDVINKGKAANPAAPSSWYITVAVADGSRQLSFPVSQIGGAFRLMSNRGSEEGVYRALDSGQSDSRETRVIVTGNLLKGFEAGKSRGKIINFTKEDGSVTQGIILPADTDLGKLIGEVDVELPRSSVTDFLEANSGSMVRTGDGLLSITAHSRGFRLTAPASRASGGGKYFLNKGLVDAIGYGGFIKRGNLMLADVSSMGEIFDALEKVDPDGVKYLAVSHKDEARKMLGIEAAPEINFQRKDGVAQPAGTVVAWTGKEAPNARETEAARALANAIAADLGTVSPDDAVKEVRLFDSVSQSLTSIARVFGKSLHFVVTQGTGVELNGAHLGKRVYLDVAADNPALHVVGHELVHGMKQDAPEVYKDFVDAVTPILKDWDVYKAGLVERMSKEKRLPSDDLVTEELLGDFVGEQMTQPEFWDRLAQARPNVFARIASNVVNLINRVLKAVGMEISTRHFSDLTAAREAALNALARYSDAVNGVDEKALGQGVQFLRKATPTTSAKQALADADEILKDVPIEAGTKRDLSAVRAMLALPHWIAKDFPVFGKLYDRQMRRVEDRSTQVTRALAQAESFLDLKGKPLDKARELIWQIDGKKIEELGAWQQGDGKLDNGRTRLALRDEHYDALESYLQDSLGASATVAKAVADVRRTLDSGYIKLYNRFAGMKDADDGEVTKLRTSFGKIHNYFPHTREGDFYVKAIDPTEKDENGRPKTLYREHFNVLGGSIDTGHPKAMQARLEKEARKKIAELKAQYPGAKWSFGEVSKLPEAVFQFPIPVEAIEQVIKAGVSSLPTDDGNGKNVRADVEKMLEKGMADVLKARGFGQHLITRQNVPGFIQDDIKGAFFSHVNGLYGFMTKMEAARDFTRSMRDFAAAKEPKLYDYGLRYMTDMLQNASKVDRTVGILKSIGFAKYLGLRLSTAAVNLTQNIISGIPTLSMHADKAGKHYWSALADLTDLAKYSLSGKLDKVKGLAKGERDMLDTLYAAGDTRAQFMEDMRLNVLGSPALAAWSKTMQVLGWPMEISERFNRASLALAAYRAARAGDVINKGQMGHDNAVEFARMVTNDAHFVYQKGNMPQPLRGSDAGKLASSAYQFRRFSHNMWGLWMHMLKSGDRGRKAFARSIAGLIGLGGLAAVPFYKTLMATIMKAFGDDGEEWLRRKVGGGLAGDLFIYGFPAIFGGQLASSIGMDLPIVSNMTDKGGSQILDLVGVPGAFLRETGQSLAALKAGNVGRALAMSPVTPSFVRNTMEAHRLATEGAFTQTGKPIPKLGEHGPMKLTTAQAIAKALGFSPVELANQYAAAQSMEAQNEFRLEAQSKFANRYVNAKRRNDLEEMREIRAQVKEWNAQALKDKKRYMAIDLATAVRSRGREQGPPKRMMGRAKEMQEVY